MCTLGTSLKDYLFSAIYNILYTQQRKTGFHQSGKKKKEKEKKKKEKKKNSGYLKRFFFRMVEINGIFTIIRRQFFEWEELLLSSSFRQLHVSKCSLKDYRVTIEVTL